MPEHDEARPATDRAGSTASNATTDLNTTSELPQRLLDHGIPVVAVGPGDVPRQSGWQRLSATDCDVTLYRPGDAWAMVTGHGLDAVDEDTKVPGNTVGNLPPFTNFGVTRTPSGGAHYLVPSGDLRTINGLPGVGDYKGGCRDGSSRGLLFLPGSVRTKYPDGGYVELEPWRIEECLAARPDPALVEALGAAGVSSKAAERYLDDSPLRPADQGLHPAAEQRIQQELGRLDQLDALGWAGPGWDDSTYRVACNLVEYANSNWTGYTLEQAEADLHARAPLDGDFTARRVAAKWESAVSKVNGGGVPQPSTPEEDFATRPRIHVPDTPAAVEWARVTVGTGALSGVMRRGGELVVIACEGEDGYVAPTNPDDFNGPRQLVPLSVDQLLARMVYRHDFYRITPRGHVSAVTVPRQVAAHACADPDDLPNVRDIIGMTDFPLVRADGTLLEAPGYDADSRLYYAPAIPLASVPVRPTPEQVAAARDRLLDLVVDFPFVSDDDRANWLGALITPALRLLVPGPYKGFLYNAPDSGSGKTLLASVAKTLYGGVVRSSWPRDDAEVGKEITTVFDVTEAPVVVFDNVAGDLKSRKLEGLLTAPEWSERRLGSNTQVTARNDRLWCFTSNNLTVKGDLGRRLVKIDIDPNTPDPELRDGFKHTDLLGYVQQHRGQLLADVLTLVRAWAQAGSPTRALTGADSYHRWRCTVDGVLQHAGVVGEFDSEASRVEAVSDDDQEWGEFLRMLYDTFGTKPWLAREVVDHGQTDPMYKGDRWPSELLTAVHDQRRDTTKTLGRWLKHRSGRWVGPLTVRPTGGERRGSKLWRIDWRNGPEYDFTPITDEDVPTDDPNQLRRADQ